MYQNFEQINAASKEVMDSQLASVAAVSKSMQTIATETADYAKKSMEMNASYFEKLMGQKSLEGAMEVQSEYARTAYENFVAESKKFGALYQDLAKEMAKPMEKAAAQAK
ncbi:phasin family protein [Notoacmeibacter ruber]|uniref:Phasin family protein n=1 Tax=Notoacmeibacter ruber TaxID=2670375 RepID=A0A3L7JBC9_9HYPH|nr:phasin family protein [Notoacmeibacter ruber]RLQ87943.1 phasin family protein [Notoacmeibacter ruber]